MALSKSIFWQQWRSEGINACSKVGNCHHKEEVGWSPRQSVNKSLHRWKGDIPSTFFFQSPRWALRSQRLAPVHPTRWWTSLRTPDTGHTSDFYMSHSGKCIPFICFHLSFSKSTAQKSSTIMQSSFLLFSYLSLSLVHILSLEGGERGEWQQIGDMGQGMN